MQPIRLIKRVLNLFRRFTTILFTILLSLTFVLTLQYYNTEIYNKKENSSFTGNSFYNPYRNYKNNTLKANFHAHSAAWFNLTNGNQQPQEIYNHYHKNGYDLISLSNYEKITRDNSTSFYIPVYEHGYNLQKRHQLVINSDRVSFFDFAVIQSYHSKQQVIKEIKKDNGLVALAHPNFMHGYTKEDMKYLKGYDFVEVFNNYRVSVDIWDAALSSGYPAWILANDDCHDIANPDLSLNSWNRISSTAKTQESIINALKEGCHYGVRNLSHSEINYLDSCKVSGNNIKVYFRSKTNRITFIADNGAVRKELVNEASASYIISPNDSYVRVEAETDKELICLNPVIRYNGEKLSSNIGLPAVNIFLTILFRLFVFITSTFNLMLILLINGRLSRTTRNLRAIIISNTRQ